MTKKEKIKLLQVACNAAGADPELKEDGIWGPLSQGEFDKIIHGIDPIDKDGVHNVIASSFADPKDIYAFMECKKKGKSDNYCFKYGDNGVGNNKLGGHNTKKGSGPSCALPPEDLIITWGSIEESAERPVLVKANGKEVIVRVRDTMPLRKNITNGAGIDLNPDACEALELKPPVLARATWEAIATDG